MMSPGQLTRYWGHFWPRACKVKGWAVKDSVRRRHTTAECMRLVHGPQTDSTSGTIFGADEITALFCYLEFLASPASLEKSQRWLDCQQDYVAFNRGRQADWFERQAYGEKGSGKLRRNRFGGASSALGKPQDTFDPEEARKRCVTMAKRARAKGCQTKKSTAGDLRFVAVIGGRAVVGPEHHRASKNPASAAATVSVNSMGVQNPF